MRREAQSALGTLRDLAQHSSVARRGAFVLESLLAEEARWEDAGYRQKRKAEGGIEGVVKRLKLYRASAQSAVRCWLIYLSYSRPVVQTFSSTSPPKLETLLTLTHPSQAIPMQSNPDIAYQLPHTSMPPPTALANALDDDWRVIESLFSAYPDFLGESSTQLFPT